MQSIITKYYPPTDNKPARILAKCARGSKKIPVHGPEKHEHELACLALRQQFAKDDKRQYGSPEASNPWLRSMVCGQLPSGEWAHVFINS